MDQIHEQWKILGWGEILVFCVLGFSIQAFQNDLKSLAAAKMIWVSLDGIIYNYKFLQKSEERIKLSRCNEFFGLWLSYCSWGI